MLSLLLQLHDGMSDGHVEDLSPAMRDVEGSCPSVHFAVPMFGGLGGPNSTDSTSSYHTASDQAHTILGVLLLAMVLSWGCFVMELARLRPISKLSGYFQLGMGVYLWSWLLIFMHPQDVPGLWAYTFSDQLQLQHAAIASLLCAGGLIELLQAYCLLPPTSAMHPSRQLCVSDAAPATNGSRSPSSTPHVHPILVAAAQDDLGSHWTDVWAATLVMVGLIFMLHPQHSYSATIKHLVLGAVLVLGPFLMVRGKRRAWKAEMVAAADSQRRKPVHTIDWSMVIAGGFFALAACILVAFREHAGEGPHMGTSPKCQPSFVIVVAGYVLAGGAVVTSLGSAWRQHLLNKRREAMAAGVAAAARSNEEDGASDSSCLASVRARMASLGASRAARRVARAFGSVDEEEKEGMVGLQSVRVTSDSARNISVADGEGDVELELSSIHATGAASDAASPASSGGGSAHPSATPPPLTKRDLVHRYAMQADSADQPDNEEEAWRELQRDARRQEDYTGEEE